MSAERVFAAGRLRELLSNLRESFWFIPSLALLGAVLLGMALIEADLRMDVDLTRRWPRLFGAGVEGARGTLSAIATSMITVAGVVFSVTIVALSLAASSYSPRVLRTFMHDRPIQVAFAAFVGIFAYCLVVLRSVGAAGQADDFVPGMAVLGAIVLALGGVWVLVYFIHHVASAIQVSTILQRIAAETGEAIDRLFPERLGEGEDDAEESLSPPASGQPWRPLPARRSGYIAALDKDELLGFARSRRAVLRMELGVGEFAIESLPLASLLGGDSDPEADADELDSLVAIGVERTIEQDAEFGVQQIVDVAARALSSGINDPSTAVLCIDHLCALLVRMARRRTPSRLRSDQGELRVIAKGPTFGSLAALAFEPLTRYARGRPDVLAALERAARTIECACPAQRASVMRRHLDAIAQAGR